MLTHLFPVHYSMCLCGHCSSHGLSAGCVQWVLQTKYCSGISSTPTDPAARLGVPIWTKSLGDRKCNIIFSSKIVKMLLFWIVHFMNLTRLQNNSSPQRPITCSLAWPGHRIRGLAHSFGVARAANSSLHSLWAMNATLTLWARPAPHALILLNTA